MKYLFRFIQYLKIWKDMRHGAGIWRDPLWLESCRAVQGWNRSHHLGRVEDFWALGIHVPKNLGASTQFFEPLVRFLWNPLILVVASAILSLQDGPPGLRHHVVDPRDFHGGESQEITGSNRKFRHVGWFSHVDAHLVQVFPGHGADDWSLVVLNSKIHRSTCTSGSWRTRHTLGRAQFLVPAHGESPWFMNVYWLYRTSSCGL